MTDKEARLQRAREWIHSHATVSYPISGWPDEPLTAEQFHARLDAPDIQGWQKSMADFAATEVAPLEKEIVRLRGECERLDADGDKWMNRAAVAETKLETAAAAALREAGRKDK